MIKHYLCADYFRNFSENSKEHSLWVTIGEARFSAASDNDVVHGEYNINNEGRMQISRHAWENLVNANGFAVGQVVMFLFYFPDEDWYPTTASSKITVDAL